MAAASAGIVPLSTSTSGRKESYYYGVSAGAGSGSGSSVGVGGSGSAGEGWKKQQRNGGIMSSSSSSTSSLSSITSSSRQMAIQIVNGFGGGGGSGGSNNNSGNNTSVGKSNNATPAAPTPTPTATSSSRWQPTTTTTSTNSSNKEVEERRIRQEEIATRRRKHQAMLDANKPMEIFLSKQFRTRIEKLLLSLDMEEEDDDDGSYNNISRCSNNNLEDNEENGEDSISINNEEEEMEEIDTHRLLVRDGFSSSDVLDAMKTIRRKRTTTRRTSISNTTTAKEGETRNNFYEEVLQYLCIRLNEDELPSGFDPRGGTLDVVRTKDVGGGGGARRDEEKGMSKTVSMGQNEDRMVADETTGDKKDRNEDNDGVVLRFAKRFGLTRREAYAIRSYSQSPESSVASSTNSFLCTRESEGEDYDMMRRAFSRVLVDAASLDVGDGEVPTLSEEDRQRNLDASSDEIEAMESIFVGDGELSIERNGKTTCVSIALPPFGKDSLFLGCITLMDFIPIYHPWSLLLVRVVWTAAKRRIVIIAVVKSIWTWFDTYQRWDMGGRSSLNYLE